MKFIKASKLLIIYSILLSTSLLAKGQDNNSQPGNKIISNAPVISFESTVNDYGSILKNGDGKSEFVFKNTGKSPLVIYEVKASCGCTVPTWPKEPIMPGQRGSIKVIYDAKETGVFIKTITVKSNAVTDQVELTIQGEVYE